jgi:hypothetical protein
MGAKVSPMQGVVPVRIEGGKLYTKDRLGVVHIGFINCDVDFEEDDTFYADLLFVNVVQNGLRLICRYDCTWSLCRTETMELLDMGSFKMVDPSILETEYAVIGYYLLRGTVYTMTLDLNNNRLVHVLQALSTESIKDFAFRTPFISDVDLLKSTAEAHYDLNREKEEIFIYTESGRLNTEGLLYEIPRPL